MFKLRLRKSIKLKFVDPVYKAIYISRAPKVQSIKNADVEEERNKLIGRTELRWQLPNYFVVVDGEHVDYQLAK